MPTLLDNPIWSSLTTEQAKVARGTALAKRYDAEVAPFAAVGAVSRSAAEDLAAIVAPGDSVYLVGIAPAFDARWTLLSSSNIVQMIWKSSSSGPVDAGEIQPLTAADTDDMVALTTEVFPGFFRRRTPDMGAYVGIRKSNVLAAMAGERMWITGHQEISAVCTHPQFTGQGYAARRNWSVTPGA